MSARYSVEKIPAGAIVVDRSGFNVLPGKYGFVWTSQSQADDICGFLNGGGQPPVRESFEDWVVRKTWLFDEVFSCAPLDRDLQMWPIFHRSVVQQ